jgi:ADP-ribosylation factor-like protein 2-binding protein
MLRVDRVTIDENKSMTLSVHFRSMANNVENLDLNDQIDETIVCHTSVDKETEIFDRTIGLIEDLIMDDEFRSIQQLFVEKYSKEFDPTCEENKLIFTDIHREYLTVIEDFIINKIKRSQVDFDLNKFMKQLELRQDELFEGEIFEFLLTFTDFLAFKQWMIEHRQPASVDIGACLQAISLTSAHGSNPTTLPSNQSQSCDQPYSSVSLDLGITGTKISKPRDPNKQ